jgi:hypothetical protein
MAYPTAAVGHVAFLGGKLLGCYELETHDALETIIGLRPAQIVDVGAADGYYVVGLARRAPEAHVIGYELDRGERRMTAKLAGLNGVAERVSTRGFCDPAALAGALAAENAVLLCDCEGYERELLDPQLVPQLRKATILAELHPMFRAGIEEVIRRRFQDTHDIELIRMRVRKRDAWPELERLSVPHAFLVLSEGWRTNEEWHSPTLQRCWAFMRPQPAP